MKWFLSLLLNRCNEAIAVFDRQGKLIFANNRFAVIHNYSLQEIMNKHFSFFHPPEQIPAVELAWQQVQNTGEFKGECWQKRKDGEIFPVLTSSSLFCNPTGEIIGVINILVDITEDKKKEEERRRFQFIIESVGDAIFFKNVNSQYLLVNKKTLEVFGLPQEQVLGRNDLEIMSFQEEAARNIKDDEIVFKTGECRKVVKRMTRGDGKEYWFEAVKIPYRDSEGKIVGLVGIAKDITERKIIEEALRISMEKLNAGEKTFQFPEKDIALKEVLQQIEEGKRNIKQQVITNTKKILQPLLQRMRRKVTSVERKYFDLLERSLNEIVSSFPEGLNHKCSNLTSREIEVCTLIKEGFSSKEIANLLNISLFTVNRYREYIRKKLNITNKKVNLASYLRGVKYIDKIGNF